MPELLDAAALAAGRRGLQWRHAGNQLLRELTFADFAEAMRFVNAVAEVAEAAGHHPDMTISWNRVGLALSTHSAGGLTQLDLDLARGIDALVEAAG